MGRKLHSVKEHRAGLPVSHINTYEKVPHQGEWRFSGLCLQALKTVGAEGAKRRMYSCNLDFVAEPYMKLP